MRILTLLAMLALSLTAAEKFGKALTLPEPTSVATILEKPETYTGKTVQVKGKVTEVCQMMGCWLQLRDGDKTIRFKVTDGDIVFPKNSAGRTVVAEGVLQKIELNQRQAVAWAKHEADERGLKFDPARIKTGMTMYQIQGAGALLVD